MIKSLELKPDLQLINNSKMFHFTVKSKLNLHLKTPLNTLETMVVKSKILQG